MVSTAPEVVRRAEPGRVLTVFCEDVALGRRQVRAAAEDQEPVPTLVALEWERAPSLARELDEIVEALAGAAASLWPDWYITAEQRFERKRSPDLPLAELVAEVSRAAVSPSTSWLREAWRRGREGKSLVLDHVASGEQVRQLSRALDPSRLVFVLSVGQADANAARRRGLARAAEWLAHEAQAKTLLLAPASWQAHQELDHVSYGALNLPADVIAIDDPGKQEVGETRGEPVGSRPSAAKPAAEESVHVLVGPIVGKPHPRSEVETLLHHRLCADRELAELFEYNQRLAAFGDKQFIVDLVWKEGRLVVEIDGPEHRTQFAYLSDRDRDYRLYMSGYTTLRVTNDEVCVDVELVVAKIRNIVSLLRARSQRAGE
jgi:very-short-patch-repair endonuclease